MNVWVYLFNKKIGFSEVYLYLILYQKAIRLLPGKIDLCFLFYIILFYDENELAYEAQEVFNTLNRILFFNLKELLI